MIIPAFDLFHGQAVRLYQGNYLHKKVYDIDLYKHFKLYKSKGIKMIHLVDLDGAKNVKKRQLSLFKDLISSTNISIQIGGGIRSEKDISTLLNIGASRVVIGSSAILNKIEVKKWLQIYGSSKIVIALDVRISHTNNKVIAIHGWQKTTNISLEEVIEYFSPFGLKHVLCTDISKDGTLLGPNISLYKEIVRKFKYINFQASGGVSNLNDILDLKKIKVDNIIIGRSLLEKNFTIEEALQCWQKES